MEKIKFTSIYDLIERGKVDSIISKVNKCPMKLEPHACHQNSALMCSALDIEGYEVYFCTGFFWKVSERTAHSFNRIVIDNKSYYVDFTAEIVRRSDINYFDTWVVEEFTTEEIWDMFEYDWYSFSPIIGDYSETNKDYFNYRKHERISYENFKDYYYSNMAYLKTLKI